ncbi:MAG: hypothetical protein ALAOOOJD_03354 [bacterium]|nr:hypothetical protein [bacterium]
MIFRRQQFVIERHANRVKADVFEIANVVPGDVVFIILFPERRGFRRADQFFNDLLNLPMGGRDFKFKHVAFRQQPIAEIDPAQQNWPAVGGKNLLAVHARKSRWRGRRLMFAATGISQKQHGAERAQ